jgi:hypothetical protein
VSSPQVVVEVVGVVAPQVSRGDAFEGVDQAGQLDGGGEADEEVDVVVFSVELAQFAAELVAYVAHDGLAVVQDLVGEHAPPILRHEHQVCMAVPNRVASTANGGDFCHDTNVSSRVC